VWTIFEKDPPFRIVARFGRLRRAHVSLINDSKFASASSISCRTGRSRVSIVVPRALPQLHPLNVQADQADTLRQGIDRLQRLPANSSDIKCKSPKYGPELAVHVLVNE
jgi:hypothetical protein